jgi:hypothetical protein
MTIRSMILAAAMAAPLAVLAPAPAALSQQGMGMQHGMGHGAGHGMGHGMGMMLQGGTATDAERAELYALFMYHPAIRRSVENLPDGYRSVTESDVPELAAIIVSHVTGMLARLEEGRDAAMPIQSPTLAILFANRDRIVTRLEPTETGIVVIQTSDDPATVAALQTHAAEVSDMAARGMQPVHERMMAAPADAP